MFDELVESNVQNDLKKRRKFFVVSSVAVGFLFSVAVVVSIYAADYSLGDHQFELVEMITPVEPSPIAPEPEPRRMPTTSSPATASQVPTRQVNMVRLDETPLAVPTSVSTVKNAQLERPAYGTRFNTSQFDSTPANPGSSGREPGSTGSPTGGGLSDHIAKNNTPVEPDETIPPPAVVKKPDPPKAPISKGVLNGRATDLPKPNYPAIARNVGAAGLVTVQVLIDEKGRVVTATAVSGHVMLRPEAERAARNAKFSPTLLSDVPVRVTGVITYNFTK